MTSNTSAERIDVRVDVAAAPVACTLSADQAEGQLQEWHELQQRATAVAKIDDGARMTFPATLEGQIRALADREAACCAFLEITVQRNDDPVQRNDEPGTLTLEITSPNPDAAPVIHALVGISDT